MSAIDILDLRPFNVTCGVPDFSRAANGYSVCDAILGNQPLYVKLKGYVVGGLYNTYTPETFMLELDEFSIEKLEEVEQQFANQFKKELVNHPFKSCFVESMQQQKLVRLKLPIDKRSGMYDFETTLVPNEAVRHITNGRLIFAEVAVKFYVSKERSGLFFAMEKLMILT